MEIPRKIRKTKWGLGLVALVASLTLTLFAPFALAASPESISMDVSPANPKPGENVTIKLSSYAANLDSVMISWSVDGQSTLSGIGQKSLSVTAGGSGTTMNIAVQILLPDGQITKSVALRPGNMTLLWQANDSYVPPFYRGKALPSADSSIKVVAMPEIRVGATMANPKSMTFYWEKNYINQQNASGYGKNYFTFVNDFLDDNNRVSVEAFTAGEGASAAATINVDIFEPEMLFYKNDPALGTLWEQALQDTHFINGEEVVVAAPYFISPKELWRPELVWRWFINDMLVDAPSYAAHVMPLRATPGASGTSKVKLEVENQYKFFQATSKEIFINF